MDDVRILEKRRVFDDIFGIDEAIVEYRRHDGSWSGPTRQLSFERGDSVAALLTVRGTGRLLLVRQFRYPTCEKGPGWLDEIVAGGIAAGESPEDAMAREIREETGHEPGPLQPIATFYVSPGGTSERVILFHAEVSATSGPADSGELGVDDEDIRVIERDAEELWRDFVSGNLQDGKTIVALLWHRLGMSGDHDV